MKRIAIAALLASTVFSLVLLTPDPAGAQVVPLNRNAVGFSVATFTGATVYSVGFSYGLPATPLDITAAYSFQSVAGTTGSLLDVGVRYHFQVPAPGVDIFLSGGLASENGPFPGFGTVNASGFSVGGGASVQFTPMLAGYARGRVVSLGGVTNSVIDLGAQLQLAPRIFAQAGYINFAGSGGPYLGVSMSFP